MLFKVDETTDGAVGINTGAAVAMKNSRQFSSDPPSSTSRNAVSHTRTWDESELKVNCCTVGTERLRCLCDLLELGHALILSPRLLRVFVHDKRIVLFCICPNHLTNIRHNFEREQGTPTFFGLQLRCDSSSPECIVQSVQKVAHSIVDAAQRDLVLRVACVEQNHI